MKIEDIQKIVKKYSESDEYYFIYELSEDFNIRFSNNRVISNGINNSSYIVFSAIVDKKVGVSSTTDLSEKSLENCIKNAYNIARESSESEDYFPLPEKEIYYDKDKYDFNITHIFNDIESKILKLTKEQKESRLFGYITGGINTIIVSNSNGLFKENLIPRIDYSINIKDKDVKRSVWQGKLTSEYNEEDIDNLYRKLLLDFEKTKIRKDLKEGRYKVILSPSALSDMLIYMMIFMSAKSADEGRSPFTNMVGKKAFPEFINLYTDPLDKRIKILNFLLFSLTEINDTFDIGIALEKKDFIKDGVLKGLISSREYDKKMGYKNNSFSPSNLILKGSEDDFDSFIKDVDEAIYINNLWYIREVDPQTGLLTGLTRDGVYKIENGKFVHSLNNFRFNQSPIKILENTIKMSKSYVASPREFGENIASNIICPYVLVEDFNLSSVSKAI